MSRIHTTPQHPMRIDDKELLMAPVANIRSCGPQRVEMAIRYCLGRLSKAVARKDIHAWDPLCGNGVVPAEIRAHFSPVVSKIHASDTSMVAVDYTRRNLERVNVPEGAPVNIFRHNILRPFPNIVKDDSVDMVLTDPPLGRDCHWVNTVGQMCDSDNDRSRFMDVLFAHLQPKMKEDAVIALITDARLKVRDQIGNFGKTDEVKLPGWHMNDSRLLHVMKPI